MADRPTSTPRRQVSGFCLPAFPLLAGAPAFFLGSYKITPDIAASVMLNYAYNRGLGSSLTIVESAVIKTDNAYLNPTLATLMKSNGLASVTVNSNMTDPLNIDNAGNIHNCQMTVGLPVLQVGPPDVSRGVYPGRGAGRQLVLVDLLPA